MGSARQVADPLPHMDTLELSSWGLWFKNCASPAVNIYNQCTLCESALEPSIIRVPSEYPRSAAKWKSSAGHEMSGIERKEGRAIWNQGH